MHKFMISTVAAVAGIAFATAAQAGGDCGYGHVAETKKPVVTADGGKATEQQTPITTKSKKGS